MDDREFLSQLEEVLGGEPGSLRGDERLAELKGWDSLAVVCFIAMADSSYGVALLPARIAEAKTVPELRALLGGGG